MTYFVVWPLSLVFVKSQYKKRDMTVQALPDCLQTTISYYLPNLHYFKRLTDILILPILISSYIYIFDDDIVIYVLLCFCFRCVCYMSTILPVSTPNAMTSYKDYLFRGEHDLIYSGHISHLYAPLYYMVRRNLLCDFTKYSWYLIIFMCSFILIGSKNHYTIDIILVFPCCQFIYNLFGF